MTSPFSQALDAIYTDNCDALQQLLQAHPDLATARVSDDGEPYDGYFGKATLLHHLAGNPIPENFPKDPVALAHILLQAGAEADAETIGGPKQPKHGGWTTLSLTASGLLPTKQGFLQAMIETLTRHGADVNHRDGMPLWGALYHVAENPDQPSASQLLHKLGAKLDVRFAAGLGLTETTAELFQANAKGPVFCLYRQDADVWSCPTHEETAVDALMIAALNNRVEVVGYLLDQGVDINAKPKVGMAGATALHRAVQAGWEDMVRFLVERGADRTIKDDLWDGAPIGWAKHMGKDHLKAILES